MRTIDEAWLDARERAALETAARVLKDRFPVVGLVLFGSRARGEGDSESDLDLLVLTAQPLDWRERQAVVDALFDVELEHDVVLSPLVIEHDAWRYGPYAVLPIHAEIERDGIAV